MASTFCPPDNMMAAVLLLLNVYLATLDGLFTGKLLRKDTDMALNCYLIILGL